MSNVRKCFKPTWRQILVCSVMRSSWPWKSLSSSLRNLLNADVSLISEGRESLIYLGTHRNKVEAIIISLEEAGKIHSSGSEEVLGGKRRYHWSISISVIVEWNLSEETEELATL